MRLLVIAAAAWTLCGSTEAFSVAPVGVRSSFLPVKNRARPLPQARKGAPLDLNMASVLLIGGTRFSGAYLWRELHKRGHQVTVYNRGKTAPKPVARESDAEFQSRVASALNIKGDRSDPAQLKALIDPSRYEYVYDMNAREVEDTAPLAELFVGQWNFKQYVFMSSAGVGHASRATKCRTSKPILWTPRVAIRESSTVRTD